MQPYRSATERVLHRWFVQYNPVYIASAVLVLVGITLMNGGLATDASRFAMLAPRVVSELYALACIGSAALLVRRGRRRAAWFVAMFAVVYQCDLTLGTETYALVAGGAIASALWVVLFSAKIHWLGRALQLEISRSAMLLPVAAASMIALVPHLQRRVPLPLLAATIALTLAVVSAAALATERQVLSRAPLTPWQAIVLRRSLRATWSIWTVLGAAHATFWVVQYELVPRTAVARGATAAFVGFWLLALSTASNVRDPETA